MKSTKTWQCISHKRDLLVDELKAEGYTFDEFRTAELLIPVNDKDLDYYLDICIGLQKDCGGHYRALDNCRREEIRLLVERLKTLD